MVCDAGVMVTVGSVTTWTNAVVLETLPQPEPDKVTIA